MNWQAYNKFYEIVDNSHIPKGCSIIEPYPFIQEAGLCKDPNGYGGGYCSKTLAWNPAECFRTAFRHGVVAVTLGNDGVTCKSIYASGASPTNCPDGFTASQVGDGKGHMAVDFNGVYRTVDSLQLFLPKKKIN